MSHVDFNFFIGKANLIAGRREGRKTGGEADKTTGNLKRRLVEVVKNLKGVSNDTLDKVQ